MDPVEAADYLDALGHLEAHAGNTAGAEALYAAAKLMRARNDTEDTDPQIWICGRCGYVHRPLPSG